MALVPSPPGGRSFMDISKGYSEGALQARSAMRPNMSIEPPGKTVGGAISSTAGMGMAGYMMAATSKGVAAGPYGALIGAGLGLMSYLFS